MIPEFYTAEGAQLSSVIVDIGRGHELIGTCFRNELIGTCFRNELIAARKANP